MVGVVFWVGPNQSAEPTDLAAMHTGFAQKNTSCAFLLSPFPEVQRGKIDLLFKAETMTVYRGIYKVIMVQK